MRLNNIAAALLAGGSALVIGMGFAAPAQALVVATSAYIIEGNGVYTLVNNTQLYAYKFTVTNPAAATSTSSTSQAGWSSLTCTGGCLGNLVGFEYFDTATANDIAPGQTSRRFFYSALPASNFVIYLHDSAGNNPITVSGPARVEAVPEPASWALMMVGLGAAGTALRRRRISSVAA